MENLTDSQRETLSSLWRSFRDHMDTHGPFGDQPDPEFHSFLDDMRQTLLQRSREWSNRNN